MRERVGLIDLSTLGKLDVKGADAGKLLDKVYTNRLSDLRMGRARYSVLCDDAGIILDDGTISRLADDHFFITTTTGNLEFVHQWLEWWVPGNGWCVHVTNVTGGYAAVNVAGPHARALLQPLTGCDLRTRAFPYMACREAEVAGVPCLLLRIGFVGETGWEIHFPAEYGEYLWETLMEAGREHGLRPFGVETQRVLRLEKRHVIVGVDTDATSNPLGADMAWVARLDKEDFIGKAALLRAQGARPARAAGRVPHGRRPHPRGRRRHPGRRRAAGARHQRALLVRHRQGGGPGLGAGRERRRRPGGPDAGRRPSGDRAPRRWALLRPRWQAPARLSGHDGHDGPPRPRAPAPPGSTESLIAQRPQPFRCSALYRRHLASGATMVEHAGWRTAAHFTGAEDEARRVRDGAGLGDVSLAGQARRARHADGRPRAWLERALGAPSPSARGGAPDLPRQVWRLAHGHALVTCGPEERAGLAARLPAAAVPARGLPASDRRDLRLRGAAAGRAGAAVPSSHRLTAIDVEPEALPDRSAVQGGVAHVHTILLRADLGAPAGVPGYWLLVAREYGEYLWDTVLHAGQRLGIAPFGASALDALEARP